MSMIGLRYSFGRYGRSDFFVRITRLLNLYLSREVLKEKRVFYGGTFTNLKNSIR